MSFERKPIVITLHPKEGNQPKKTLFTVKASSFEEAFGKHSLAEGYHDDFNFQSHPDDNFFNADGNYVDKYFDAEGNYKDDEDVSDLVESSEFHGEEHSE